MTGGVRGFVQVDDTRRNVRLDVALQRRAAVGDGRKVPRSHEHCTARQHSRPRSRSSIEAAEANPGTPPLTLVIVLEEEGPRARVKRRRDGLRLDGVLLLRRLLHDLHRHCGGRRAGTGTDDLTGALQEVFDALVWGTRRGRIVQVFAWRGISSCPVFFGDASRKAFQIFFAKLLGCGERRALRPVAPNAASLFADVAALKPHSPATSSEAHRRLTFLKLEDGVYLIILLKPTMDVYSKCASHQGYYI